ncbi:hypothetical protein [Clostridium vincentii]|uniref:Uncharacterized protein n=1 Tax=Clostridium vincentii TaxID=52704 RepID=A0A2T0BCY8_9CLOT|nr:hypothetical protein [Clostridium vincentii]PRR81677.1 hypothetical protein CLVI_22860 [Clostridium vincentii]
MKKCKIRIIMFCVFITIYPSKCNAFAANIPEKVEEVKYFLQVINTPFWIWFFRIAFCVCMLGILISFFYYRNKKE